MIAVRLAPAGPFLAAAEPGGSGIGFVGSSVGGCLPAVRDGRG